MHRRHFQRMLALAVAILASAFVGWRSASTGMATVDEREALMQVDRAFDQATAETGLGGWVSYFAEDGQMFPAGAEIVGVSFAATPGEAVRPNYAGPGSVSGRAAIREAMASAFKNPGFTLRWKPLGADVSRSGDLGYTYGTYVARGPGPQGQIVERHGKYVSVWKRQADGSWKVVVDIGNASPAPPRP